MSGITKGLAVAFLAVFVCLSAVAARAGDSTSSQFGYGVTSVVASAIYAPLKLAYATLGLIGGGAAYVLTGGNAETAKDILDPTLRGTYVISENTLKGKERVIFFGARQRYRPVVPTMSQSPPTSGKLSQAPPG